MVRSTIGTRIRQPVSPSPYRVSVTLRSDWRDESSACLAIEVVQSATNQNLVMKPSPLSHWSAIETHVRPSHRIRILPHPAESCQHFGMTNGHNPMRSWYSRL